MLGHAWAFDDVIKLKFLETLNLIISNKKENSKNVGELESR